MSEPRQDAEAAAAVAWLESERDSAWQAKYDSKDYRRSLYTNTKPDHPLHPLTDGPCDCEIGGSGWERGEAMRVRWPSLAALKEIDLQAEPDPGR